MTRIRFPYAAAAVLLIAAPTLAPAQSPLSGDSAFWAGLRWRAIGPANMSGRITDVEGLPSPSRTFYVAAAAGGIWKTTNGGTTFRPVFDNQRVISMGDIAIAPSDSNTVWAGTGEEDSRNSISPGGGIYKSTDGGMSWQLMGLEQTQAIGRIVIHPTDPNTVLVAALGHPWGANPERGLYKTTDGGRNWRRVKFISDKAGFVDLAMHPQDPNVLFAASWERVRGPYFLQSGGPGSGLWKSTDGGETWAEVRGGGFPETTKGRIGIAIAASNPDVMYALVEAAAPAVGQQSLSGLYRSEDGGRTWTFMNDRNVRPFYYSQVRVDPADPNRVYWSSTPVNVSNDGGKTTGNATIGLHVDHHAMWIDPNNPRHFIVGNDGGIGITWDAGGTYDYVNTFPLGQFYEVSYNMAVPYRVCGGLQDNGTWCGPSRTADGEITNYHWGKISGGDGFFTAQDPTNPRIVYAESQGGNVARLDIAIGERTPLRKPTWRDRYKIFEDSIIIAQPDTSQAVTPEVARRIQQLRARAAADSAGLDLRFNWNTPFFISPHSPTTLYVGANRVLKSTNRGEDLVPISPDLSTQDTMKIRISTTATGGVTPDLTGAETYSTIVALAESPLRQGLLYAGTDDGNVWMSPDDGKNWQRLNGRFRGLPAQSWVRRIEPSRHDANTFYVAFDRHRDGDYTPYVYMTTDGGRSFRSIAGGLPRGGVDFVHVIREDPVNPNLLFVGTDVGVYVSLDRGASWRRFMAGLPTVPVHDLQIHPRDAELIAGTHGRSIWIADIAPLQQLRGSEPVAAPLFFQPKPALQYGDAPAGGEAAGHKVFATRGPEYGAEITYFVPASAGRTAADAAAVPARDSAGAGQAVGGRSGRERPQARIAILTPGGDTAQVLPGPATPGLHRVYWNLRLRPEREELSPSERRDSVLLAERLRVLADSMIQAGSDRQMVERAVATLQGDEAAGGGRSGGARSDTATFEERPGEQYPAGGSGDVARDLRRALSRHARNLRSGYNPFGGGFGGPEAPHADPGEYSVSITIGEQTLRQNLRVERAPGFSTAATP
jgi:photosystem II stability/assembly factor-like uncharacterized protein